MTKVKVHSRAQAAALIVKNKKVEKMNQFYLYYKDIIDKFQKLQEEVSEANSNYVTATTNTLLEKFPPRKQ